MKSDIQRWNQRYLGNGSVDVGASPDEVLAAHLGRLPVTGRALDLACGTGENTLLLSRHGLQVVGIDCSIEGLRIASRKACGAGVGAQWLVADLDAFVLPRMWFDVVVIVKYLIRGKEQKVYQSLRPGGVLFYRTFNQNLARDKPGFNPAYLLKPGELRKGFPGLELIAYSATADRYQTMSFILGRKPFAES